MKPLYDIKETAQIIRRSPQRIVRLAKQGILTPNIHYFKDKGTTGKYLFTEEQIYKILSTITNSDFQESSCTHNTKQGSAEENITTTLEDRRAVASLPNVSGSGKQTEPRFLKDGFGASQTGDNFDGKA